jgi:pimeloyl-ACP methyl ester carboxylesterase
MWLLKGIGLTILAAAICGYLSLWLLFYQGQWQLVLHPSRTTSSPSSIAGIAYQPIHFAVDSSAVPQLTGWWIPATPDAPYARSAILFLPGASGSLANSIPTLASLHRLGINVFAFDYRGYGQSAPIHPSQQNMLHDAESAWQYLTMSRAIPTRQIILYGINIGTSLATQLALHHPAMPGLILDSPYADLVDVAAHDPRTHLIPVSLLFHERFPLAQPLSTLSTPKLLISRSSSLNTAFQTAAEPRMIVQTASDSDPAYSQNLLRFLDQSLHLPPAASQKIVANP